MKAIYYKNYGGPEVLSVKQVPIPEPSAQHVLVKVHSASINSADWRIMRGNPWLIRMFFGLFRPKNRFMGSDFSGTVAAVGAEVTEFKIGDAVLGNLGVKKKGSFAQFLLCTEKQIVKKPPNIDFEAAACLPLAAQTAFNVFKDILPEGQMKINKDYKILINGASGGVGIFALQMAVLSGAEVTAVCSTRNIDLVTSFGPDFVIDYKTQNIPNKEYDRVLAVNGTLNLKEYRKLLTKEGHFFLVGSSTNSLYFETMLRGKSLFKKSLQSLTIVDGAVNKEDLEHLTLLLEKQQLRPHIDKTYLLEETPSAMQYFEDIHPSGKLLIRVDH